MARAKTDDASLATASAAVLGAVFVAVAYATHDARTAGSVAVGAAIAIANLLTMRAIVRALLREPEGGDRGEATETPEDPAAAGRRGGVAWGIFALLKILLLFGGIWFLLTNKLVDPIPLVVGYGVLPLGIAASSLIRSLAPR